MSAGWSMRSDYGQPVESLEVDDWVSTYRRDGKTGRVWGRIVYATPAPEDVGEPAMDVAIVWEGETRRSTYRLTRTRTIGLTWHGQHRPVCAHCGGSWPCEHVQMHREMRRALDEESSLCVVCGKAEGNTMEIRRETPDGIVMARYHTAKSRKSCRAALIRAASEDDLRSLRMCG